MDLSKAFDLNNQDLLIAKLNAYGFGKNLASCNYSYFEKGKQCACMKWC